MMIPTGLSENCQLVVYDTTTDVLLRCKTKRSHRPPQRITNYHQTETTRLLHGAAKIRSDKTDGVRDDGVMPSRWRQRAARSGDDKSQRTVDARTTFGY